MFVNISIRSFSVPLFYYMCRVCYEGFPVSNIINRMMLLTDHGFWYNSVLYTAVLSQNACAGPYIRIPSILSVYLNTSVI